MLALHHLLRVLQEITVPQQALQQFVILVTTAQLTAHNRFHVQQAVTAAPPQQLQHALQAHFALQDQLQQVHVTQGPTVLQDQQHRRHVQPAAIAAAPLQLCPHAQVSNIVPLDPHSRPHVQQAVTAALHPSHHALQVHSA